MKKTFNIIFAAAIIYAVAYLFYRSYALAFLFTPLSLLYPAIRERKLDAARKNELTIQFKDMLYSLSSSMSAGRTFEAALRDVRKDLAVLNPINGTAILEEVDIMLRRLEMNDTVEVVIDDFAERTGLEDIRNFSDVFRISKRSGANLLEVIRNTTSIINDKIEILQEIEMLLAERRFEQKVLNVLPILMILILSLTAYDYIEPVFTTSAGRIVMTAALAMFILAWVISRKITDIRV